ncbi:MAG TPA: hypothetical protein PKM88_15595 [bacterium]|nr:hypothetical protein [bacterium]
MLLPIELRPALRHLLIAVLVIVAGNLLLAPAGAVARAWSMILPLLGAMLAGTVGVPLLLPWLPARSFVVKGLLLGALWTLACGFVMGFTPLHWLAWLLLLPPLAAYYALNFTGATTFTSQTGVNREIGWFARPLAVTALVGAVLLLL